MARSATLGKVVARAARGPFNLSVIGLSVVGAVALGSWPLLALGGAAYAALVAADLANPSFRRRTMLGRPAAPATLPRADAIGDGEVRASAEAVRLALAEIRRVGTETPERVRRHLQRSFEAVAELERHAAGLVARADDLSSYLTSTDVAALRREAERLEQKAQTSADAEAREQYQQAHAAAIDQLRAVDDIAAARARVIANLSRIAATLRGVPAKVVRMRALDEQASDALSGDVGAELDRMNIELKAFEQTLVEVTEANLS